MKGLVGGQYKPLSDEDVTKIHETSLRILEEIGVKVGLEEALNVFKKNGAKVNGEIVRIPPSLVEQALRLVPHRFLMAGREEKNDLILEDKRVYLGTGGAALNILDLDTGEARPGTLRDVAQIAKLVDALENVHFYLRPCIPQDIPKELVDINQFYVMLSNTTKHVMAGIQSVRSAREVIEMAQMVAGGNEALVKRPFISFVTSWMISPLQFNTEITRILLANCKTQDSSLSCYCSDGWFHLSSDTRWYIGSSTCRTTLWDCPYPASKPWFSSTVRCYSFYGRFQDNGIYRRRYRIRVNECCHLPNGSIYPSA